MTEYLMTVHITVDHLFVECGLHTSVHYILQLIGNLEGIMRKTHIVQ